MEEIHSLPSSSLFSDIQFKKERLPVGGSWEQVSPVVIRDRSCSSIKMSSKYQFSGDVNFSNNFSLKWGITLQVVFIYLAQCSMICRKVTFSGPTASTSMFYFDYSADTISSAMS